MNILITTSIFLAAILAAFVVTLICKPQRAKMIIIFSFVIAIIGGLATYGYAYLISYDNLLLSMIKTLFAIIRMFLGEESYSDMADVPGGTESVFQFIFWTIHVLALFAAAGTAITVFGTGMMRRLRIRFKRTGDLSVIFGVRDETLDFGRKLNEQGQDQIVYVTDNPGNNADDIIESMNCVLRTDSNAILGTCRFLKSLGMVSRKKRLHVYALSADSAENQTFADHILKSLKALNIAPKLTALTILGAENETDNPFQVTKEVYGYGNAIVLNETEMAARLLMLKYPPHDCISFDTDGKATEDFHCLIIGFGSIGQAVLKQLVQNGQFDGSRFKATIFAPNYEQVIGKLWFECEQMFSHYDISFFSQDARSIKMYDFLSRNLASLKYIVICTGDDSLNTEISEQLLHFLTLNDASTRLYQCSKRRIGHHISPNMIESHDIYTPSILCSDRIDQMAMLLNQAYCAGNGLSMEENWFNCDYFSRMSSRASADFSSAFLKASGATKQQLILGNWNLSDTMLESLAKTEHERWCAFHYSMGFRTMTDDIYQKRCEAYLKEVKEQGSSRIRLGKDLKQRLHACLIDWDALDELSQKENAVTGKHVNYKQMDRNNVLMLPALLKSANKEN